MKTTEELRKLDQGKLNSELEEVEKSLFEVKFNVANGQASNTADIKKLRTQKARIKTIQAEKIASKENMEEEKLEKAA